MRDGLHVRGAELRKERVEDDESEGGRWRLENGYGPLYREAERGGEKSDRRDGVCLFGNECGIPKSLVHGLVFIREKLDFLNVK